VVDSEGAKFALKLLRSQDIQKRKRFKNELAFCRNNLHDNIVKVIDEGLLIEGEERRPFYVMPLYDSSLRKLMKSHTPVANALELFTKILDGVEAAHLQKVVHRDLKPENILCDGKGIQVVVADFGIAHFSEEKLHTSVLTGPTDRRANFLYAAPEQRQTGRSLDERADVYALGLMLNELFTGRVPQGTSHRTIAASAPEFAYLDELVDKMIRQAPEDRPPTIRAVKQQLQLMGVSFAVQQKLDKLQHAVVRESVPDDPLGGVDVRVGGFEYRSGRLHFRLSPPPPSEWTQVLHELRVHHFIPEMIGPNQIEFHTLLRSGAGPALSDSACVPTAERDVVVAAKRVQAWVASANRHYRQGLIELARQEDHKRRDGIEIMRREFEARKRANELLRQAELI